MVFDTDITNTWDELEDIMYSIKRKDPFYVWDINVKTWMKFPQFDI